MNNGELKRILVDLVDVMASLEEQVRSLEVLTSHHVDHRVTDKIGIPQKMNALHAQVQSLRTRVRNLSENASLLNS